MRSKGGITFEDVRPRCLVAAVKLDLLESRECAVYAFCDASRVNRLAHPHASNRQTGKCQMGGYDLRRVCGWGQHRDVHREAELAQTRALCREDREAGGGRAGLCREIRGEVEHFHRAGPKRQFLDLRPPARDGREVGVAQVGRDGCVEYEAAQVGEEGKWGERGEREVQLWGEGVVERLAEAG